MWMINDFYDVKYWWENDKPIIKLIAKKNKQKTTEKCSHIGTTENWFIYYYGESIGKKLYIERKKLYSKWSLIDWYIDNFNPVDKYKLLEYKKNISNSISKRLTEFYSTPSERLDETKKKYKKRSEKWAKIIGKHNQSLWKNDEWKSSVMEQRYESGQYQRLQKQMKELYSDPEFKDKFMISINNPDRIDKISKKSKEMWKRAKEIDNDLYYRMANSAKGKNFELNGYKMNHIEFIIGSILNELLLEWEYEKIINIDGHTYLPDFFVENKKIIVECYGDFWHGNPKFFNETDRTHKKRTVNEIWKYDKNKKKLFEEKNYVYLYFWEDDIQNNLNLIKEKLNEVC